MTSLVAQMVKRLPTMRETQVRSLGWEDPLGKEMATHSSTLAWKIPWTFQRSVVGYSPWGRKESDMTERLHFHFLSLSRKVKVLGTLGSVQKLKFGSHSLLQENDCLSSASCFENHNFFIITTEINCNSPGQAYIFISHWCYKQSCSPSQCIRTYCTLIFFPQHIVKVNLFISL